jgi:perosamine synthetase
VAEAVRRIPLFRTVVREPAVDAVGDVLRSGWLGMGAQTKAFEEALARVVGARHCVAVNSGTAALRLALRILDLEPGTVVLTTPLTFVSANTAILEEGLVPRFADVEPTTGNLDAASVAELADERTGAILVMHYGGYPCDLDAFARIASDVGAHVVEDCAHALGAVYGGRPIGSHEGTQAFSFNPVKNLPMSTGGALTVDSPESDARLRRLRAAGVSSDVFRRLDGGTYSWDYDVPEAGLRAHMTDVDAAIGLAQLPYLEQENERRAAIAARYRGGLAGVPGLELLRYEEDRRSSNHLFCVLAERRDDLVEKLGEHGIDVGVHYRPSYCYPMFEGEPLPNVESFWRRVISLPMHLLLEDEDVDRVVDVIRSGW